MKTPRRLHLWLLFLALLGIALFIYLLLRHNLKDIAATVAATRWYLLAIIGFHLIPLILDAFAWGSLFPPNLRPALPRLLLFRWIGEAVSTLLPATQVGGDIIRARLAGSSNLQSEISNQPTLSLAAATVLGDIMASILAQTLFTLTGLILLASLTGRSNITIPAIIGAIAAIAAVAGFYLLQHRGLFRLLAAFIAKLARSQTWHNLIPHAQSLDDDLRSLFTRKKSFLVSILFTLCTWFAGSFEVYLALYALQTPAHPPSYAHALILEAVGQGIRSAMFFIPAAIGIQEAGYLGIGTLLGLPPDISLALSLIRRVRELAVGIPGLLAWHLTESRRLLTPQPLPTTPE